MPAYAQQTPPAAPGATTSVAIPRGVFFRGQVDGQILSSDNLIGAKIHGTDDKIIADIEELILSSDLRVEGVIIGTGGFLGTGEKRIGLRFSALRFGPEGKVTVPELTKEVIAALPAYERRTPHGNSEADDRQCFGSRQRGLRQGEGSDQGSLRQGEGRRRTEAVMCLTANPVAGAE
jgi:hypothetical protein